MEVFIMKNRLWTLGLLIGGLILASCGSTNSEIHSQSEAQNKGFTVTWKNYDGAVLEVDEDVEEGSIPTYDGATPTKEEDNNYTYTWNGWEPEVAAIYKDETYTATFTANEKHTYLTVSEAIEVAVQAGPNGTEEKQYVKGFVKNITNTTFGEMYITDGTNDLYIYGVYSSDGELRYCDLAEKPYTNDEVYLYGYLKTYDGNAEMGQTWLLKMVSHQGEVDVKDYQEMSILNARQADEGAKVLVQGVVASITYANGQIPSGIYLVDDTSSIYIYSPEIAGRVEVGEEVKLGGVRDNYILEDEVQYAEQFGYQGSIQLTDAIFVESLGKNKEFIKNWIKETTMKKLMETPLTDNVTTEIYKVTAIVNKAPGSGFTNYYINDLDNETGSYVYTLCNGKDFSYLDKYDGKICTVYVSIHNAKSTKTGIVYRLMPIKVIEIEDFSMSDEDIAKFALEYYGARQFLKEYNSDPELELLTGVSNEYIPFENVAISYESDNDSLVNFANEEGKLVMHLLEGTGEVNLTLTAEYKGKVETLVVTFNVIMVDISDTISVEDAIALSDGTIVTVRGIVMSSLVNQTGFYLNDGTGVIAVRTTKETIGNIAIGNEVVMKGTRTHVKKADSPNVGQSCIDEATIVANLMGKHDYDKSTFITNLTFEQIFENKNKQATQDLSCNVYVASCYLRKNQSAYSTNYYLSNENHDKEFNLYASSGGQYADYDAFSDGRLITVEFMLCDWNTKNEYRACIISATDGETTVLNTLNFK